MRRRERFSHDCAYLRHWRSVLDPTAIGGALNGQEISLEIMTATRVNVTASLAVIAVSAAFLWWTLHPIPPSPELRPHEALGEALAQEAAKIAAGGRVVVIALDNTDFKNAAAVAELKAVERGLKKANLATAATILVKLDPLRLPRVPANQFYDVLRKYTEKDVVISLLGPPVLDPNQRANLPPKLPQVIAACTGDMPKQLPMKKLFETGMVRVAIISRPDAGASGPHTGGPAEWFSHFYQVIGAANMSELPPTAPGVASL